MIKKSLYWGMMVSSLYFVWGCSESKSGQAIGAETAQTAAEEAVASAEDVVDILAGADAVADEGAAMLTDEGTGATDESGYTDEGSVNPIKQLLEGEPIELSYSLDEFATKVYNKASYEIVIQAKTDKVTVYDIIINRGNNCQVNKYDHDKKLPASLSFGRMVKLSIGCDPNYIREIEVKTDYGNYKFGRIRN
ncbi:hypothetical protein QSV37_08555 [Acinetobacter sp. VNK23]|uniref:hypothetical protein n=1 Tax=Acinetobacter thutiue TaxID=2998078 RepID=UPI0025788DDB|nr:hypothetical protein [Acinetobacter thutiue]MDM1020351.1 hypothetical protein [Acinetobacter thutiue]